MVPPLIHARPGSPAGTSPAIQIVEIVFEPGVATGTAFMLNRQSGRRRDNPDIAVVTAALADGTGAAEAFLAAVTSASVGDR
jgi:hypothetical protein